MVESVGRRARLSLRCSAWMEFFREARRGFLNLLKRKARGPPMIMDSGDS